MVHHFIPMSMIALILATFPAPAQNAAHQRLALVIGNQNYPGREKLQTPANDARDMDSALKKAGFLPQTRVDLDHLSFKRAVDGFVSEVQKGDTVLFYYAGHGSEEGGVNYLHGVDFQGEVRNQAISLDYILGLLRKREPGVTIVILDACRTVARGGNGLARVSLAAGEYIAFATSPGKPASDEGGANGLFTKHLLREIGKPGLTIDDVFNAVRLGVSQDSNGQQVSWSNSGLIGTFCFHKCSMEGETVAYRDASAALRNRGSGAEEPECGAGSAKAGELDAEGDLYRDAACAYRHGQYGKTVGLLNGAIKINDGNAAYHGLRGQARAKLRQLDGAIADLRKAIELQPDQPNYYLELGRTFESAGDNQKASEALQKAYELAPDRGDICLAFADILDKMGAKILAAQLREKAAKLP